MPALAFLVLLPAAALAWNVPALNVYLSDGQARSYPLHEVQRLTFQGDSLFVKTAEGTDGYEADGLATMGFDLEPWAGVDDGFDDIEAAPVESRLFQNRPNPFAPRTLIAFDLPVEGHADLQVFSVDGRVVRTLIDERLGAGPHAIHWDGMNDSGVDVASGVYFYRLTADGVDQTRKMVLLR
jgi:hypothetical protein